ncbi:MAG: hypothetical protein U0836_27835 [Pirellulales bacterium]
MFSRIAVPVLLMSLIASQAEAASLQVAVPATSCVFFAGKTTPVPLPPGRLAADYFGDLTDERTIPFFIGLKGAEPTIGVSASGLWAHGTDPSLISGPDGRHDPTSLFTSFEPYADFGISRLTADINTLMGVFTTDNGPLAGQAPPPLAIGQDMKHPLLNQSFAIGSELTGIFIPAGATRLYLGLHDGGEWNNNQNQLSVVVTGVPEPTSLSLAGAAVLFAVMRRLRTYCIEERRDRAARKSAARAE